MRYVHHHPLLQGDGIQCLSVTSNGDFVVGTADGILDTGLGNAPASEFSEISDRVYDHGPQFPLTFKRPTPPARRLLFPSRSAPHSRSRDTPPSDRPVTLATPAMRP